MALPAPLQNPRARAALLSGGLVALLLVVTQLLLPGDAGPSRGTPAAILFSGIVNGFATALIAAGIVVVYRTIRIINFAQSALGVFGASFCFELVRWTSVPFPIALVLGVALGALMGVAFDLIFGRRFFSAPRIVLTVLTITATGVLAAQIGTLATKLPIFPNQSERSIEDLAGVRSLQPFLPFSGFDFHIGGLNLEFHFAEVLTIELAIIALVLVGLFFRYTRVGVAVRALAENADRAALLGISVGTVSTVIWALSGALSATGGILLGSLTTPGVVVGLGASALTLFGPLAAAVLARMRSIPVAAAASIGLSVIATAFQYSYPDLAALTTVLFLAVIVTGLLLQRRRGGRSEESGGVSWEAVEETRPVPKELAGVSTVRYARIGIIAFFVGLVLLWPFVATSFLLELGSVVAIQTIIYLSLVVLTGWAGQISLAQYAFAAVGGVVAASLTARVGVPFWFAVPMATAFSGLFAAVVGIPALRIKGLFLAVPTLALAFTIESVLFEDRYFGWLLPGSGVDRPSLFLLDFEDNRSMYYLCVASAALAVFVVVNLRRSRFGRILIALRENEANVQSFGVSAFRMKILSFAVSGAIAGFGGAIFVHQQRGVAAASFGGAASIDALVFTVFGGIGSPLGAILGSLFQFSLKQLSTTNDVLRLLVGALQNGGGTMILIFIAPGGLISLVMRLRDSVLRIIAQRRQIVVPSLFADYDPEALERRLVPLGENISGSGLAAIGPGSSFRLPSELYGEDGLLSGTQQPTVDKPYGAIGAAAESFADAGALTQELAGVGSLPDADERGSDDDIEAALASTGGNDR
jgi:branched-chain amino acid transport system permease protein